MKKKHLVGLFLCLVICLCGVGAFMISYHYSKNDTPELQQDSNDTLNTVAKDNNSGQSTSATGNAESSDTLDQVENEDAVVDEIEPENRQKSKESIYAESMSKIPAIFILKIKEGQVIVYHSDGITMYETTGIMVEDLPYSVLRELIFGKPITTFDELYNFLENYSS